LRENFRGDNIERRETRVEKQREEKKNGGGYCRERLRERVEVTV
jgi:hypothetical protein